MSLNETEVLDHMRGYAYRRALAMGISENDAEDAAQEATLKVWKALKRLDGTRDPWPLLSMAARQEVWRFAQALYSRRAVETLTDYMPDTPDVSQDPAETAIRNLTAQAVRDAVAVLPPLHSEAVRRIDLNGEPVADVAESFGYARDGAYLRQVRQSARQMLKPLLAPYA